MGPKVRRTAAIVVSFAFVMALPASASAITDRGRAVRGVGFLAGMQRPNGSIPAFSPIGSTSDAVLAFVATGLGRPHVRSGLGYLRRQTLAGNVTGIGLQAKVLMAVTAAGRNPRTFADTNLVRQIRSQIGGDGHIGTAAVFDQALAILAIESADVRPAARVARWLLDAQCPDGGWAYDAPFAPGTDDAHCDDGSAGDFFTSDSNTTAYAVQALEAAGRTGWGDDPFAFFDTVRDPGHGGWAYSSAFLVTDANSTGLVLQAYVAGEEPIPAGGLRSLRRLQHPRCGAWAYTWNGPIKGDPDTGATIGAIPGLLRIPFPLAGPVSRLVPPTAAC